MAADIYGFVFVRCEINDQERLINTIKDCRNEEFDQVTTWPGSNYSRIADYQKSDNDISCWLPEQDEMEPLFHGERNILTGFSEDFSEVIAFYTIEDYYHYQHWKNGQLLRILDGNDDGINCALGTEESWERECFSLVHDDGQENEYIILVDAMNRAINGFYGLCPVPFKVGLESVIYKKN